MRDFGMELHAVKMTVFVGNAGNRATVGTRHELEARWHFSDLVAMTHPDGQHALPFGCGEVRNVLEQRRVAARPHVSMAKFAFVPALDLAAQLVRHGLHAIADAQHRNAQLEHRLGRLVGGFLINAGVAA